MMATVKSLGQPRRIDARLRLGDGIGHNGRRHGRKAGETRREIGGGGYDVGHGDAFAG